MKIIGYSVRSLRPDDDWTTERRDIFLLNPGVALPLSADSNVWAEASPCMVSSLVGPVPLPCWGSVDDLIESTRYSKENNEWALVTILEVSNEDSMHFDGLAAPCFLAGGEYLLGFEVVDNSLNSSLSNCGYTAGEIGELRDKFGEFINSGGLLSTLRSAIDFLHYSKKRLGIENGQFVVAVLSDKPLSV